MLWPYTQPGVIWAWRCATLILKMPYRTQLGTNNLWDTSFLMVVHLPTLLMDVTQVLAIIHSATFIRDYTIAWKQVSGADLGAENSWYQDSKPPNSRCWAVGCCDTRALKCTVGCAKNGPSLKKMFAVCDGFLTWNVMRGKLQIRSSCSRRY